ncbi:hypothetical protein Fot_05837 [Forsythia ovata]|uniref:Uncharacterized protein n=1 Tax=Forsythia ovata TaxID=205694 RepID=A0ABD1WU32_9LAMI
MKFSLAGVLSSVTLTTDDEGSSSPRHAKRRKTTIKAKRKASDKNTLVSANMPMKDDHIELTRGVDPMQTDGDQIAGDYLIPDLHFLPAHARRDMEVMRSCVFSQTRACRKKNIEDVEKVLAVYHRKVLTFQDSVVKACMRMVTDLEVFEDEKSKKVHHLKKKNSSLKKSCEASEARVKEREKEIDNLRYVFAHAQHDAVESYKASSEYQHDLSMYGAESMSVSISLTKEWTAVEHPGVNPRDEDQRISQAEKYHPRPKDERLPDHLLHPARRPTPNLVVELRNNQNPGG